MLGSSTCTYCQIVQWHCPSASRLQRAERLSGNMARRFLVLDHKKCKVWCSKEHRYMQSSHVLSDHHRVTITGLVFSAFRCDANYPKTLQKKQKTFENTSNYSEKMPFRKGRSSQDICLNVFSLSSKVQVYVYIYIHIITHIYIYAVFPK